MIKMGGFFCVIIINESASISQRKCLFVFGQYGFNYLEVFRS